MPAHTPISHTKTAALSRILDSVPKGYTRWTHGVVAPEKAESLIRKLHQRHAIGASPAQRLTRKKHGKANAVLALYWPQGANQVQWLMLFTQGELDAHEALGEVTDKERLVWLGYELVRHANGSRTSWTFRRPKQEMAQHYAMLAELSNKRQQEQLAGFLQTLANQPGFHGVRTQTGALFQEAVKRGFPPDRLPFLYFLSKVGHGELFTISQD